MIVLPGPVVLADPLPSGWRRFSSLGCGAPTGHDGAHVPEAVPPRPVAPAGRWVRRCRTHACGLAEGHAGAHETLREPPCTCSRYDGDTRCNACEGLVWQSAAVAVAGPEVDVAAEVAPTRAERIEAAARALLDARATYGDALAEITARRALRAALESP